MGLLSLTVSLTLAHATGVSGYSGKVAATQICNACHTGGTAPSVFLQGPNQLMAGASATYTVMIQGGAGARAGFNAAASAGTFIAGVGEKIVSGEVTQSAPATFSGTTATFSFTFTAPATAGTVTMYAAGNSVNNNQSDQGDKAASATLDITVMPGTMTMDAGMPEPDAGTAPDSGVSTTPSSDGGTAGPPVGDGGTPSSPGGPAVVASKNKGPPAAWEPGLVDGDFGCAAAGGLPLMLLAGLVLRRRARA